MRTDGRRSFGAATVWDGPAGRLMNERGCRAKDTGKSPWASVPEATQEINRQRANG